MLQAGAYFSSAVSLYQYSGSSCVYIYLYSRWYLLPPPRTEMTLKMQNHAFSSLNNMENVMQENICAWHFLMDVFSMMEVLCDNFEEHAKDAWNSK